MTRKRKPIFFVACEGAHNKTESNYLQHFKNNNGVSLKIKPTSNTAPETMLDYIYHYAQNNGYEKRSGDKIFMICDIDTKEKRHRLCQDNFLAQARKKNVTVIMSNPSLEVWFLDHFIFTSHCFSSQKEIIQCLKQYLPKYKKSDDVYPSLPSWTIAKKNAIRQWASPRDNIPESPGTNVDVLLDALDIERK